MSEFDQRAVVALLEQEIDAQRAAVDAIQYHGLDSLLDGTPQTLSTIAALSGLLLNVIEGGVQALIEVGRIEVDGDRVIGIGGLTMTPTEHSLTLPNAEMHTWCTLDAVGIPAALGLAATVQTRCPHCSARITVDVAEGGATSAGAVALFCPTAPCGNVRADFCSATNLFCSQTHLTLWRDNNPTMIGHDLDLDATVGLGHAMWGQYKHPPNGSE